MKKLNLRNRSMSGITLISLVITIIILLILSGISIVALTGNNGLINQVENAKEQTEIANEKELIEIAVMQSMTENRYGNITEKELQNQIDKIVGENLAKVIENGDIIVVELIDSNRYYEIDYDGKLSGPIEIIVDEYAGDLTKGGRCDGSESKPYEINCIEDLVVFSIATNGGNTELNIASNNYSEKYVILTRTLDFKSIFSYNDYTTTIYDEFLGGDKTKALKTQLSSNGKGFVPIENFQGIFDGKGFEIKNIYENRDDSAGLFSNISSGVQIVNLGVTGNLESTISAAGIVANVGASNIVKIENCYFDGKVESTGYAAGGICADLKTNTNVVIDKCYNLGEIISEQYAGGIVGFTKGNTIMNCFNKGEVYGNSFYLEGVATTGTNTNTDTTTVYNDMKMKSEDFVKELNDYIDNNSEITEGWLRWKLEENDYPVFE